MGFSAPIAHCPSEPLHLSLSPTGKVLSDLAEQNNFSSFARTQLTFSGKLPTYFIHSVNHRIFVENLPPISHRLVLGRKGEQSHMWSLRSWRLISMRGHVVVKQHADCVKTGYIHRVDLPRGVGDPLLFPFLDYLYPWHLSLCAHNSANR